MYGRKIFNQYQKKCRPERWLLGSLFLFFFSLLFNAALLHAQNLIPAIKRDDFNQVHAWWQYHRDGIPKSDTKALRNGDGFLFVQLSNPLRNKEFNVGISEFQNIYSKKQAYLSVEARIKLLSPMRPGSRGWGFWKSSKGRVHRSIAWFMQQKDAKKKRLSWSLVGTVDGKRRQVKPWQPDINTWHVYRIERDLKAKTTRYWIDGKPFFTATGLAPRERLSFHLWMDNQVYSRKDGVRRQQWQGREAMVVDYVQIQTKRTIAPQPQISDRHILLYRNFNTILHGKDKYSVGTFPFTAPGDSVYLLLTVRAEDLRPYDLPDRLTVWLDDEPEPFLQVKGEKLKGQTRTFFKKRALSKGKHRLRVQAQSTPLLYDLLVLDATGSLVTINKKGDSAKQFDWRNTRAMSFLTYAAVTAREAPSFDQIHWNNLLEQQDDDLQIQLSGLQSSFNKKLEFCGNKLFGDCKTRLLSGAFDPDDYTLTIKMEGHPQLHRLFLVRWFK